MRPRTKLKWTIGSIGFVLGVCSNFFGYGFFGVALLLIMGGIVGYLMAQQEKLPTKKEGARVGALAGLIIALSFIFGQIVGLGPAIIYAIAGVGLREILIVGLIWVLIPAVSAGAGAGYFATIEQPTDMPPPMG